MLRKSARARRRALVRQHWAKLVLTGLVVLVGSALAIAAAGLIWSAEIAWFFAGLLVATTMSVAMLGFDLVDPVSRRIQSGADGEWLTARELRRLRRAGWRTVHNVHLAHGDIDHVAVGPAGVVAIETKASDSDWDFVSHCGATRRWARQARDSSRRARWLIAQHADIDVEPVAVVSVWVRGAKDGVDDAGWGVRIVHGSRLAETIGALGAVHLCNAYTRQQGRLPRARPRRGSAQLAGRDAVGVDRPPPRHHRARPSRVRPR